MRNLKIDDPNKLWDFTPLNGCFGRTGIKVSDIDGIVERKGHLLVIETKRPGERMEKGQRLLFAEIVRQGHMVIVVTGRSMEDYDTVELLDAKGDRHVDTRSVIEIVATWFVEADSTPDPYTVAQRQINRNATLSMIDLARENENLRKENAELQKRLSTRRRPRIQISFMDKLA